MQELDLSQGLNVAKYYKYFEQFRRVGARCRDLPENIQASGFYKTNKTAFDKIAEVGTKYELNIVGYLKWYVLIANNKLPDKLATMAGIKSYAEYVTKNEQYKSIYDQYLKTASYIAKKCIATGIVDSAEYIKKLIVSNRLAAEYMAGNISGYFLASIQNFKKIYTKLDDMNQKTLVSVYKLSDKMNSDVQDVFMMYKNQHIKPIKFTNGIIDSTMSQV